MSSETKSSAARAAYHVGLERGGDRAILLYMAIVLISLAFVAAALVYGNTQANKRVRDAERAVERAYSGGLFSR